MDVGSISQAPDLNEMHAEHSTPHGNENAGLAGDAAPSVRMRLLHVENSFGELRVSEYCLEAMLSLVLFVARSARPDQDELERPASEAGAACPANDALFPDSAAGYQAATDRCAD